MIVTEMGGFTTSTINEYDKVAEPEKTEHNIVDHPRHYNREGAIECIDEMVLVFGEEATAHFCLLNCWKYRYRAGLKNNGFEDIEKSDWYMQKYKELKEKKTMNCSLTAPASFHVSNII